MRRVIPLITTCLLSLFAAEPLFAQQRLFARLPREIVELDPRPASLGTVLRRVSLPNDGSPEITEPVFPFAGGAYLAWVSPGQVGVSAGHIWLFDTNSGAIKQLTPPDFVPSGVVGTDGNARLVIQGSTAVQHTGVLVADARSGDVRVIDLGAPHLIGGIAYAAATDVIFVARARHQVPGPGGTLIGIDFFDIDVLRADSGAVLKTLDVSPVDANVLQANAAGTRLFVNRAYGSVFDVATGALLATNSTPASQLQPGPQILDEQRQRFIAGVNNLQAFSTESLQLLGETQLPPVPRIAPQGPEIYEEVSGDTDVSGQSATIFVLRGRYMNVYYFNDCTNPQLVAVDADTGRARAIVDASSFVSARFCSLDLVRLTEPAPPPGLAARTAGYQVTLQWHAAQNATHYEIEAGTAPGLANLATIAVSDTRLMVDGVPSGAYYLRVRAINTIGKSAASQEIQLIVQ